MAETVERRDCDERHESESKLLEEKLEGVSKDIAASETRVKLWILVGLISFLLSVGAQLVCGISEIGSYKEKQDSSDRRLEKIEQMIDQIRWHSQRNREGEGQ